MFADIQSTEIETPRLVLKELNEDIYALLFSNYTDEEIKHFLGLATDEQLQTERKKFEGGFTTYRTALKIFLLREKELGEVIGSCAFHTWFPMHARTELGYAMTNEVMKNKGYMTEALKHVIPFGFEHLNMNRIEAFVDTDNQPSLRLLEKLGFSNEALLRQRYTRNEKPQDAYCLALLKEEFELLKYTHYFPNDN